MPARVDTFCFLVTFLSTGSTSLVLPLLLFAISRLSHSADGYYKASSNNAAYNGGYNGGYGQQQGGSYQQQNGYSGNQYGNSNGNSNLGYAQQYYNTYSYSHGNNAYNPNGYYGQQVQQQPSQQYHSGYYYGGSYRNDNGNGHAESYSNNYRSNGQWVDQQNEDGCGWWGCISGKRQDYYNMQGDQSVPAWWLWGRDESESNKALIMGLLFVYCFCMPVFLFVLCHGFYMARRNNVEALNSMIPIMFVSGGFSLIITCLVAAIDGVVVSDGIQIYEHGWYGQVGVLVYLTFLFWTIFAISYGIVLRIKAFEYYEESIEDYEMYHEHPTTGVLVRRKCHDPDTPQKPKSDPHKFGRALTMPHKMLAKARTVLGQVPRPSQRPPLPAEEDEIVTPKVTVEDAVAA